MRILVTTSQWFPDYTGGLARAAQQTSVALGRRGHEVTVVAPRVPGMPGRTLEHGVVVHRSIRRGPLPETFTDPIEVRRSVRSLRQQFDVSLAHHVTSAVGATSALPDVPLSYVFHASPTREARHRRLQGVGLGERLRSIAVEPGLAWIEGRAARSADAALVLSEFSRELLLADAPQLAAWTSNVGGGVDIEQFRPAADREGLRRALGVEGPTLLTVRRLVNRMGVDVLLEATAALVRRHPDLHLVVVGDGEQRAELEALRDRLGLRAAVSFVGRRSDEEVLSWYQAADLFVLPTVAYEGFGIVTAEALACGTPVVGTAVGATSEVLGAFDRDLLAEAPTPAALATAVDRALPRLGSALRRRAREHAEAHLGWDAVIRRWEASLEALAGDVTA